MATRFSNGRARFSGALEGSPERRLAQAQRKLAELERSALGAASSGGSSVLVWGDFVTEGADYDTAPAGSQVRVLQEVFVKEAIRVSGISIDIRNAGDYTIYHATPQYLALRTLWTGNIAVAGKASIGLDSPLVLLGGIHVIRIDASVSVTWWELASNFGVVDDNFRLTRISRDSGANWVDNRALGMGFTYQPGAWS